MTDIAIRTENLSKQYRIGGPQGRFRYKTIRESLIEAVQSPHQGTVDLGVAVYLAVGSIPASLFGATVISAIKAHHGERFERSLIGNC